MLRLLFALALLSLAGGSSFAEDSGVGDALDGLSGAKMLEYVKQLAADDMLGRRTGFDGGQKAENWVIARMSEFGLHPADAGGTYLEPFTFKASEVTAPIVCKVGERALSYGTDFVQLMQTGGGTVTAEVVFCGYGIMRPDLGWDDYAGVDVKGKIVMAVRGAPRARASEFEGERYIGSKVKTAADMGAAALLLVEGERAIVGTILPRFIRPRLPSLWISGDAADSILAAKGKTLAKLKGQRDAGNPSESFATGTKVSIDLKVKWHVAARGHNALGAIHGRDPDLKHEIVLVCAHMDHVGTGPGGTPVFNGADDNASGVAVLTHLADIVTANRWKPKRTIIFCAFGAEEQGLIGSTALATRYPFEGRIVCVLNMDMVGQGEPEVTVAGGGSYPWLDKRLKDALPKALAEKTTFSPRVGASGDHWPFYERGVPGVFIATRGAHPNYHTPADDAGAIKPECLEAAARTVGTMLVKLGNATDKLEMPGSFYHYLLREGPLFGMADLKDGLVVARNVGAAVPTGWIVTVTGDPEAAWSRLELLDQDARYRLVRRASDVGGAWHEGRAPLVPRLVLSDTDGPDRTAIERYGDMGFRWMVGASPAAAKAAKVLVELGPDANGATLTALGAWPSIMARPPDSGFGRGGNVLFMSGTLQGASINGDMGIEPHVVIAGQAAGSGGDATSLAKVLGQWQSATKPGWWLPGTPQRKAIRAVLGGRLVEWLQRIERSP